MPRFGRVPLGPERHQALCTYYSVRDGSARDDQARFLETAAPVAECQAPDALTTTRCVDIEVASSHVQRLPCAAPRPRLLIQVRLLQCAHTVPSQAHCRVLPEARGSRDWRRETAVELSLRGDRACHGLNAR